jgi:large subunit ribosomal protein L7/L12
MNALRIAGGRTAVRNGSRIGIRPINVEASACKKHYGVTLQRPYVRSFSSSNEEVAKKEGSDDSNIKGVSVEAAELVFSTPRVKALYEQMVQLDREEVAMVGKILMETLDMKIEEDEFYFYGIGRYGGGGGKGGAAAAEEVVEEVKKDKFDIRLTGFDDTSKIKVIKEVRSLTGLGLKEAKDLVESAPKIIQKGIKAADAEELKAKLEAVGAQIELL